MELRVDREKLLKAIAQLVRLLPGKPSAPSLGCVLIEATAEWLTLTAFDLVQGLEMQIPADVRQPGALLLPGKPFFDVVSTFTTRSLHFIKKQEEEHLVCVLSDEQKNATLLAHPPDEFPKLPRLSNEAVSLSVKDLLAALEATTYAAAKDDLKQILQGICFSPLDRGALELCGTDGARLARCRLELAQPLASVPTVVPAKGLRELKKSFDKPFETVQVRVGDAQIEFSQNGTRFLARCLEGTYPVYSDLLPTSFLSTAIVDKRALVGALCFTDTFTDEKLRAISLSLSKDTMTIAAKSTALGWAYETIPADLKGVEIEFGINPAYLLDAVKSMPTASIALHANSAVQPIIVTPKECDNPTALIMPIQIKGGK